MYDLYAIKKRFYDKWNLELVLSMTFVIYEKCNFSKSYYDKCIFEKHIYDKHIKAFVTALKEKCVLSTQL